MCVCVQLTSIINSIHHISPQVIISTSNRVRNRTIPTAYVQK